MAHIMKINTVLLATLVHAFIGSAAAADSSNFWDELTFPSDYGLDFTTSSTTAESKETNNGFNDFWNSFFKVASSDEDFSSQLSLMPAESLRFLNNPSSSIETSDSDEYDFLLGYVTSSVSDSDSEETDSGLLAYLESNYETEDFLTDLEFLVSSSSDTDDKSTSEKNSATTDSTTMGLEDFLSNIMANHSFTGVATTRHTPTTRAALSTTSSSSSLSSSSLTEDSEDGANKLYGSFLGLAAIIAVGLF